MEQKYPRAFAWLDRQKQVLLKRSSKSVKTLMKNHAFYSIFGVGEHTIAPWKVVWRGQVALELVGAVVSESNGKLIVPDQTAYSVPFADAKAAHYFCALLNSSPLRLFYALFCYKHASSSFFAKLKIPRFEPDNDLHVQLSKLSVGAHEAVARGDCDLTPLEKEIDELAAQFWGLSKGELAEIQKNLIEFEGSDEEEEEEQSTPEE